ncbi:MAG: histidinol-phosphate transaminase [Gammaproteobacteria bacterium]
MKTLDNKIAAWVRPEIRALAAYHVPDPGNLIKLDAMENPFSWPPEMLHAWMQSLSAAPLNRYPDPSARVVQEALRVAMTIPSRYDILLGNGSDELIQTILLAVAQPGRTVLAPEPAFVMYRMVSAFVGMKYIGVALREEDFGLDMPAMRTAIKEHRPAVVFLAYPNNPTGNLFDADQLRELIQLSPGIVVVDEAYLPFAEANMLGALAEFDNLLILRTVSKLGLAGLRLGLLIGAPAWLREIDKVRLPYNVSILTQVSAVFALQHLAVLDEQAARIRAERERVYAALCALPGLKVWPSRANFILLRAPTGRADAIFAALKQSGVLIKNLHPAAGALRDCLRVTIGTPDENDVLLAALRAAL